ncbi:MAG: hypothetical protein CL489_05210, partial [Acidobacteria bacterium]|nr:hypothetical protein [Acidobacteriota bacterium]
RQLASLKKKGAADDKILMVTKHLTKYKQTQAEQVRRLTQMSKKGGITTKKVDEMNKRFAHARKEHTRVIKASTMKEKQVISVNTQAGGGRRRGGGIASGFAGMEGAAGAAQNFAMMATMAGSTAIQMSNLSEVTKKAATETLAWVSVMVGLGGTVVQMLSGLASSSAAASAAESAETAANAAATQSENVETAANYRSANSTMAKSAGRGGKGGGAGMGFVGKAFMAAAVAALVVGAVFQWMAAKARAEAEEMAKANKKIRENMEKGTSRGGGLVSGELAQVGLEQAASAADTAGNVGMAVAATTALATMATFAAMGATMGSVVPVIGTVIGALVGLGVGFLVYHGLLADAQSAMAKHVTAITDSVNAYIQSTNTLVDFDKELKDIDLAKLEPKERVQRRLEATGNSGQANALANFRRSSTEQARVAELGGRLTGGASTIGGTTDDSFEEAGKPEVWAKRFEVASLSTEAALKLFDRQVLETRQTLAEAADLEMTGEMDFDELINSGGQFAIALKQSEAAIKNRAAAEIIAAEDQQWMAREDIKRFKDGSVAETAARQRLAAGIKREKDARQRSSDQIKDQRDGYEAQNAAIKANRDAQILAAQAAEALRRELKAMDDSMKSMRSRMREQAERGRDISNFNARRTGGAQNFTPQKIQGLGDFDLIDDIDRFEKEVNELISELPAVEQAQMRKRLQIMKDANKLFDEGKDNVLKDFGTAKGLTGEVNVDEILKSAGFEDVFATLGADVQKKIKADIQKAAETGGGITGKEFEEIFAPIREQAKKAGKDLMTAQQWRDKEIELRQQVLQSLSAVMFAELEARGKAMEIAQTGANLRLEARGVNVSRGRRQQQRTQRAGVALQGTGARAGDVGDVQRIRQASRARQAEIATLMKSAKGTERERLMNEDQRLANTVKKTTTELERLASQSEATSEIMSEIEKEQGKRETMVGLLEDFVVGGAKERQAMSDAFAGINLAVGTGTIQNQTPEMRQATFGMLDKLKDIQIAGTGGMTGKQVKQELIFRDAIRMGLDPQVAEALATATSKEEELINALDRLTEEMESAGDALAAPDPGGGPPEAAGGFANWGFAQGGAVYRRGGGSLFKPKGTDTVPAMLTPGEFVIRKSAVDKIGMGNLQALNRAQGGPVYLAQGGQGVNAGAAMGKDDLGLKNVAIASGDQIRGAFVTGLKAMGRGAFLGYVRKNLGNDTRLQLLKVMKAGQFHINRLQAPDTLAGIMDQWREWMLDFSQGEDNIFQDIGRNNVTLKGPGKGFLPPDGAAADSDAYKEWSQSAWRYVMRLAGLQSMTRNWSDNLSKDQWTPLVKRALDQKGTDPIGDLAGMGGKIGEQKALAQQVIQEIQRQVQQAGAFDKNEFMKKGILGGDDVGVHEKGKDALDKLHAGQQLSDRGQREERHGKGKARAKRRREVDEALNDLANKGILRMARGGSVPGADSVPAMLTPGEFVMSPEAVQRHGVGYMKSLNRGRIPGFRRGGLIGGGNVAYRQYGGGIGGGGTLMLDPTRVQEVLNSWNETFEATLKKVITPMETVTSTLGRIADIFGQGFKHQHDFGELTMNINIGNKEAIASAVEQGVLPAVSSEIMRVVKTAITALTTENTGT